MLSTGLCVLGAFKLRTRFKAKEVTKRKRLYNKENRARGESVLSMHKWYQRAALASLPILVFMYIARLYTNSYYKRAAAP